MTVTNSVVTAKPNRIAFIQWDTLNTKKRQGQMCMNPQYLTKLLSPEPEATRFNSQQQKLYSGIRFILTEQTPVALFDFRVKNKI